MKIDIYKLRILMRQLARNKGLTEEESRVVADQYWEAELRGKTTHGVGKFCWEAQYFKERSKNPEITKDKGTFLLVDAHREIGQLSALFCTNLVINRAKKHGVAVVGMRNSQQYGTLDTWARKIADNNLVGIIANTCQPAVVAFGGVSKILGTNPLAVGIPTSKLPIVLDMSTSKVPMSLIWQAIRENSRLPDRTFLDIRGHYTTNPKKAEAVEPFGEQKGYGLALVIQILAGSLLLAKMGYEIRSRYDIGYFFQAIDPSFFQPISEFKKQNDLLIKQIKLSRRKKGIDQILIPGERSEEKKRMALKKRHTDLPGETWQMLINLSSGVRNEIE